MPAVWKLLELREYESHFLTRFTRKNSSYQSIMEFLSLTASPTKSISHFDTSLPPNGDYSNQRYLSDYLTFAFD